MSRNDLDRSIVGASFISPVINGIMHIPPAIAATRVALDSDQPPDLPVLLLLFALHVLIDVLDKYADLPSETRQRWGMSIASFAAPFLSLVVYGTWCCGIKALVRLLAVPALAIVHATPLIPFYSRADHQMSLVKLKYILGPFKSIFGGICIGLMDTTAIVLYLCESGGCRANAFETRQLQVLAYTILYDFLWESIADVRDLEEDLRNGDTTLATAFGIRRTLTLVGVSTVIGDICITSFGGRTVHTWFSLGRPVLFWALFSLLALYKPRRAVISWGFGTLTGLVPVWLATVAPV